MNPQRVSLPIERLLNECTEILETIEGIFVQLSKALEDVEDETVITNIEREKESIQRQVQDVDVSVVDVSQYTIMRLGALPSMVKGLLDYAKGEETTKVRSHDSMTTVMIKASTVMEAKGSLRRLAKLHPNKRIQIETGGAKVPLSIFTDNNFYRDERNQNAVKEALPDKKADQPRLVCANDQDGILFSPEIHIYSEAELQTVLNSHFFDDYISLGIKKRMTIIVP